MDEEGRHSRWDEEEEEADTDIEEDVEDLATQRRIAWVEQNIEEPRRVGDTQRAQFLATAYLQPPQVLRVIDIEATCGTGRVTLLDYQREQVSACGYSAISHTYGMEVYSIFDCQCACVFSSSNGSIPPRCWDRPCPHNVPGEHKQQRDRVVNDILRMCHILNEAGIRYAWHDGVCIAQHDDKEVWATIQSMGWIYSSANETIVFLHYVGKPMAPISPRGFGYDLVCRWHSRVWTLQEAALSKKRRYCVRVCSQPVRFWGCYRSCRTLKKLVRKMKEFEETVALWYRIDFSKIDVITEESFMVDFIWEAEDVSSQLWRAADRLKESHPLWHSANDALGLEDWCTCFKSWSRCLSRVKETLRSTCLGFPTLEMALTNCSTRDSKHMGDRINSVLTLAGLKDFVAPKDFLNANDSMESWTIEFFKRQGQGVLAWALFSLNVGVTKGNDDIQNKISRTWVPQLWRPVHNPEMVGISECTKCWGIKLKVCEDKRLELKGEFVCVAMTLTLKLKDNKGGSTTEHVDDEHKFGETHANEDVFTDAVCEAEDKFDETYTDSDTDLGSLGDEHQERKVDVFTNEMHDCEINFDEILENKVHLDGTCPDQQVSEPEEDEESEGEEGEETDDEECEVVVQHVEGRQSLHLELNVCVDGFYQDFLVRFLDTNIIMGAATFSPVEPCEGGHGVRIGGCEIQEGDSFDAYLMAPLHYNPKVECLIVQGNLHESVSKIGIFTMFRKLTRIFQMETDKAIDHPAYTIVTELVVH